MQARSCISLSINHKTLENSIAKASKEQELKQYYFAIDKKTIKISSQDVLRVNTTATQLKQDCFSGKCVSKHSTFFIRFN